MNQQQLCILALEGFAARVRAQVAELEEILLDTARKLAYANCFTTGSEEAVGEAADALSATSDELRNLCETLGYEFPSQVIPEPTADPTPEASDADLGIDDIPF